LPNVLLEAQSQSLPVAATRAGAIEELITDGENGLLAPPNDPAALAAVLARLIADPALRTRLGANGAQRLRQEFSLDHCIDRLAVKFGLAPAAAGRPVLSRSA
jgi:glycosyltransferase involved in cell wall biosynthesis